MRCVYFCGSNSILFSLSTVPVAATAHQINTGAIFKYQDYRVIKTVQTVMDEIGYGPPQQLASQAIPNLTWTDLPSWRDNVVPEDLSAMFLKVQERWAELMEVHAGMKRPIMDLAVRTQ